MDSLPALDVARRVADLDLAASAGAAALAEIDVAIELVVATAARRVRLVAVPFIETVAATGLARANAAGVRFSFERADLPGVATVTVGPMEPSVLDP